MTYDTIGDDVTMQPGAVGTLLAGRYRIVRQLGQGGMGSVWLVEDTQLDNKQFAIKMLPSILVSNKRAYRQLKDEALVAMQLVHPNIVQIRAFEENYGNPFLVMDYIDGETLDDYLAEHISTTGGSPVVNAPAARSTSGTGGSPVVNAPAARSTSGTGGSPVLSGLPEDEVIRLLKPIAAALDYAHSKGVVHRDVKPGNVMIAKDGTPYILDFGIAREIQETMTRITGKLSSGTLLYMSPEQLNGDAPKPAQDVYSFAAMVYECLKGEPPFSRGNIEFQIMNKQPAPLANSSTTGSLPVGVNGQAVRSTGIAASVMAGLAKKSEDRPKTCAAVLEGDVLTQRRRDAEDGRVGCSIPSENGRAASTRPPKRNVAWIVLPIICIVAALLALGGVLWHRGQRSKKAEQKRNIAVQKAGKAVHKQVQAVKRDKVQLWEGGPYWADRNIGAENPWDYGYYFWWGDTVGYKRVNGAWVASDGASSNFSFEKDNTPTYGKDVSVLKSEGWITADNVLAPKHDAARAQWGGEWRMPTQQEMDDLCKKCDWKWTTMNGVRGYIVRGRGGYASASIFLPTTGYGNGTSLYFAGSLGYGWSSFPRSDYNYDALGLYFDSSEQSTISSDRYFGQSVRPVQGFTK